MIVFTSINCDQSFVTENLVAYVKVIIHCFTLFDCTTMWEVMSSILEGPISNKGIKKTGEKILLTL